MSRTAVPLSILLALLIAVIVANRALPVTRAQPALPTPKGQLGGPVPLTPPVEPTIPDRTPPPARGFVGAWQLAVTLRGQARPVLGLATFTADGTLVVALGSGPTVAGQGVWRRTGDRSAIVTFRLLQPRGPCLREASLLARLGDDGETFDAAGGIRFPCSTLPTDPVTIQATRIDAAPPLAGTPAATP